MVKTIVYTLFTLTLLASCAHLKEGTTYECYRNVFNEMVCYPQPAPRPYVPSPCEAKGCDK